MASVAQRHVEWLSLLEISGPFLSLPVLLDAFPQGLDKRDTVQAALLRSAYEEWADNQQGLRPDPALHTEWVRYVLTTLLGWAEGKVLWRGQAIPDGIRATLPERHDTIRPDWMLTEPGGPRPVLLVQQYAPDQDLDRRITDGTLKDSPATRMMELLLATEVPLGLVTNGERWLLVHARRGETTGFISWYASLWHEEPTTLQAFQSLLRASRFFSVPEEHALAAMLARSTHDQQDVTEQLGQQVRQAVEILIRAWDKASGQTRLRDVSETRLYEAAIRVMMRLVFLLSAEERGLIRLRGDPLYDAHYAVSTLRAQLQEAAAQQGEEVLSHRYDAWNRLLATFRAIHGGLQHETLRLPAYGGSLFDPDVFPFLEGRLDGSHWQTTPAQPLPVDNRTVLHLLDALQQLRVPMPGGGPATARLLSFRALDIEQIGHVYEGLLDHRVQRATEPMLGLVGTARREPELPLARLEAKQAEGEKIFLAWLREETGRTEKALGNALKSQPDMLRAQRLRSACQNDEALYLRVYPFAGLLREDDTGYPVVIPPGSLYVTTGSGRRETGTHYTPRSLTEPIVRHTLEPLVYDGPAEGKPREAWRLRPAAALLGLKICDMALGSGAFLVQVCRYLGDRVVEAWEEAGAKRHSAAPFLTVEGEPTADPDAALPEAGEERLLLARRLVAERCLYGVDKNPLAVEMAKLSLWLVTMSEGKPFTFLDHALRCGDSLVGLSHPDQLVTWNLTGEGKRAFETLDIQGTLAKVVALRREIATTPLRDLRDQEYKTQLLREAEALTNDLRAGANKLIGSYCNELKAAPQATLRDSLLQAFDRLLQALNKLSEAQGSSTAQQATLRDRLLQDFRDGKDHPHADVEGLSPFFHWPLEFPEVFLGGQRTGFDAFVGNPPFMGGQFIRGALGGAYLSYLKRRWEHTRGSADLSAFFFLRGFEHLCSGGAQGLIATNTIAQGDTRELGLDFLHQHGASIYQADNNLPWPGQANVFVSVVHLYKGSWQGGYRLGGHPTLRPITPMLDDMLLLGPPHRLANNASKSFQGSNLVGTGFTMSPNEAQILIAQDKRNAAVLFPYLNGEDLNSSADQAPSRWVINFRDWPLERSAAASWVSADVKQRKKWLQTGKVPSDYHYPVAADYPDCLAIVREKVYPQRMAQNREIRKRYWWRYGEVAPALYETIAPLERVLAIAQTSRTLALTFLPKNIVYSHMLVVVASGDGWWFALLQSNLHISWVLRYPASLKGDPRYIPTDHLQTFPFPRPTAAQQAELERIGEAYHEHRRQTMLARQEGLTATYNRFHNPHETASDIATLRALHVEMDRTVAAAYGWDDLALGHDFHQTAQGLRFTLSDAARREVLGRLLELNHERYAEEVRQGLHAKKGKATGKGKGRGKKDGGEQLEFL